MKLSLISRKNDVFSGLTIEPAPLLIQSTAARYFVMVSGTINLSGIILENDAQLSCVQYLRTIYSVCDLNYGKW